MLHYDGEGIFGALSALASGILWLLLLRFLVGVGLGGAPVAYSLYSEFLNDDNRGTTLLLNQVI